MKLNSQLLPVTAGKGLKENTEAVGNSKITLITPRLMRVEFSKNGAFTDLPSQAIWYREQGAVAHSCTAEGKMLRVKTDMADFVVNTANGKFEYAVVDGKTLKYHPKNNLKGTIRTLDAAPGPKPLEKGVISTDGVCVFDDSKSLLLKPDGTLCQREKGTRDIYIFAYGSDYKAWIKDFYLISGAPPLIPRYALGNWWSRYRAYTQAEYEGLMERFRDENIPLTIATVDMDWHWVDVKSRFGAGKENLRAWGSGWTGYSWNTELFPDYKAFLKKLHGMGLKVTLNLHPADGVRYFEDMYDEMVKAVGAEENTGKTVPFDLTDSKFVNAYFDVVHHPYEQQGVDFWWIDWQQGTRSKKSGLDPLWLLNHYHYLDSGRDGKRPLILSRYAKIGSHRYPLGFSGDAAIRWQMLNFQPYFTANAANCGYTWWSHDIGGHNLGIHDDELYVRWIQFGVFSPVMRLHSTNWSTLGKEPWNYSWDARLLSSEFLRLRHRLIPYIYSMNYRSHKEFRALCEPMYYSYPDKSESYSVPNEYMFGSELLVCPVTAKTDKETKATPTELWLPEGRWVSFFDGKVYKGGRKIVINSPLNTIPVLAREGAVIPMSADEGNSWKCPESLEFKVFSGNGETYLYEDDGETCDFEKGECSLTSITQSYEGKQQKLTLKGGSRLDCIPENRTYTFNFCDICSFDSVKAEVNGKAVDFEADGSKVTVKNINSDDLVEITLENAERKTNPPLAERALDAVIHLNGSNAVRHRYSKQVEKCTTYEDFERLIPKIKSKPLKNLLKEAILALE